MIAGNNLNVLGPIVLAGLVLLIYFVFSPPRRRCSASRRRTFHWVSPRFNNLRDRSDPGGQLQAVMAASFEKRRLLNPSEYQVFKVVEQDILKERRGFRVFAQTSLGEILESPSDDAFRSINSKRVDILIVDQAGWPVVAVEYQGSGHYQGTAAARDAVKKEALRKAGIGYVEIAANHTPAQIRWRVRDQLGWPNIEAASPDIRKTA
jgi:hypothetical protein